MGEHAVGHDSGDEHRPSALRGFLMQDIAKWLKKELDVRLDVNARHTEQSYPETIRMIYGEDALQARQNVQEHDRQLAILYRLINDKPLPEGVNANDIPPLIAAAVPEDMREAPYHEQVWASLNPAERIFAKSIDYRLFEATDNLPANPDRLIDA